MELTIAQNGALYALHHRATKKYRGACKKRVGASHLTRTRYCFQDNQRSLAPYFGSLTCLRTATKSRPIAI
jgi:hypothetical protein